MEERDIVSRSTGVLFPCTGVRVPTTNLASVIFIFLTGAPNLLHIFNNQADLINPKRILK